MAPEGKRGNFFFFLLFALPLSLMLLRSVVFSYWGDEAYTALVVVQPWGELWRTLQQDVHPPLYWLIVKMWVMVAGSSELALRYPSILFALGSLSLFYILVRRLFQGLEGLAGFLLALSPAFLLYAPMARYYSLSLLLFLLSTLFFLNALSSAGLSSHPARWVPYFLTLTALVYTDPVTFTGVLFHGLYLFLIRERGKVGWLSSFVLSLLLFLPYGPTLLRATLWHHAPTGLSIVGMVKEWAVKVGFAGWDFLLGLFVPPLPVFFPAVACAALLFVLGLLLRGVPSSLLRSRIGSSFFHWLVWSLPVYALLLTAPLRIGIEFFPARVFFLLPAFVVVLGLGIRYAWNRYSLPSFLVVAIYLSGMLWGDGGLFLRQGALFSTYVVPWREVAKELERDASGTPTLVICDDVSMVFYLGKNVPLFILSSRERVPDLQERILDLLPERVVVDFNPKDVTGGGIGELQGWLSLAYEENGEMRREWREEERVTLLKRLAGVESPSVKRVIEVWERVEVNEREEVER